jgi:predicted DNA-binding transcriptional regulator YafY
VSTQSWHSKQRARFEADGSYVLEIPYANDRELLMDILKYGADVEVVGPAGLRKKVAQTLGDAARRYGPG